MANDSLNQFSSFVNQQILLVEDIGEHLLKASALLEVALCHNFSDFSENTLHNYLWALSDIIHSASKCNARTLDETFEVNRIINRATVYCHSSQEAKNGD